MAGLGDAREAALLESLRAEADGLVGEMVLGHLCQSAQACTCYCPTSSTLSSPRYGLQICRSVFSLLLRRYHAAPQPKEALH